VPTIQSQISSNGVIVNQNVEGSQTVWRPIAPVRGATCGSCPSVSAQLAQLYRRLARQLLARVRSEVRAPEAVIEDACQVAWGRLAQRLPEVAGDCVLAWLCTTARREALRSLHRVRRECSLEQLLEECGEEALAALRSRGSDPGGDDAVVDLVAYRQRLASVAVLPHRQRRMLMLNAAGFDYAEIALQTGDSRRTVERQLLRARRGARALAA
jgi:RNA polymerase sigma factor (sigma-70 family)